MMTFQEYRKVVADLNEKKREIETLLARDLKQELQRINDAIALFSEEMERLRVPQVPAHDRPEIYAGQKSLADLSKACLRSVNHAWLTPTDIAERLIAARVAESPYNLAGHIATALKRRMNSPVSPDTELEISKGRYRLKPEIKVETIRNERAVGSTGTY
jgi:hypothetical protein